MTSVIILIYALTAAILAIGALIGYKRGLGRATVRLVYLAIIAVASFFIASSVSETISAALLNFARGFYNDLINETVKANPQLEVIVQSLATAIITPIIFAILFGLVQLITLICFKLISSKIVGLFKKELNPKVSKWAGAGVGFVSAIVMIFALFSPITFTASILFNTPIETLELLDATFFSTEDEGEIVAYVNPYGQLKNDNGNHYGQRKQDVSVKKLRAALAVFTVLSNDYKIVGSEQSVQRELSNVIAAAGDGLASFKASIEDDPQNSVSAYLNVIAAVGANTQHSQFISTVVKEASKAVAKMDAESIAKALESVTPHAQTIASIVPDLAPMFDQISESSDKELAQTIELWFGEPPVEPSRTKEEREKEEKKQQAEATNTPETVTPETVAPETNAPETNAPETNAPETDAPDTTAILETTAANETTVTAETTVTPETTVAPETTKSPETTVAPETTKSPETTASPEKLETPEEQKTTQNGGLIGSLISGGSISEKGEQIVKDEPLFNAIRNMVLNLLTTRFDITNENYRWIFDLIKSELYTLLCEIEANPSMTYMEKVDFFAAALTSNIETYLPPSAYETAGVVTYLLKPASMQAVAIFTLDTFTLEKYPNKVVPLKDIMIFMGIEESSVPDWALND